MDFFFQCVCKNGDCYVRHTHRVCACVCMCAHARVCVYVCVCVRMCVYDRIIDIFWFDK